MSRDVLGDRVDEIMALVAACVFANDEYEAHETHDALKSVIEELAKDAERYQVLRTGGIAPEGADYCLSGSSLDEVLDVAIEATKEKPS